MKLFNKNFLSYSAVCSPSMFALMLKGFAVFSISSHPIDNSFWFHAHFVKHTTLIDTLDFTRFISISERQLWSRTKNGFSIALLGERPQYGELPN